MLENVRQEIERLIARYEAEKAENTRLRQELRACEETGAALKKQIMELESEIETRKLTAAFNAGVPADAKEKVDTLIREIDRCISWLEEA
jgi:phage shock protein A